MLNLSAATRALIVALLLALLSACAGSSAEQETETLPVDQLYAEAKSSLDNGNFERSIRYYKRLTSRFPFGDITEQAQLDLAYAQYRRAEYDDAISTVNRFIKTYPAHAKIDYANYQQAAQVPDALAMLAMCYEALGQPELAADAKRVLELNAPDHPYLTGVSEDSEGFWSKLWPF